MEFFAYLGAIVYGIALGLFLYMFFSFLLRRRR